ncbi:ABC transporter permease [Paenibacillus phocaensis]|uniref:ABC transporter permease n=1 Tax=Paenibacillus phocaensis TaxID=1776378 RepID=UPI000AED9CA2|nr:ABC transporter permease [Paenibacillus phocaensis]
MLKDIGWLASHILWTTFRKRKNLILYLGLPLGGILLTVILYGGVGATGLRVGVVNQDGNHKVAADTIQFLEGLDQIRLTEVTETELREQLASGELDSGLVLGEGYSQSLLAGEPDHLRIQSVKGAQVTAYLKAMLYNYTGNMAALSRAAQGDEAKYAQLYADYQNSGLKLIVQSADSSGEKRQAMTYLTIGFLILFMMMSAVNLSELILKSREDRTFFRVISSPINARNFVIANLMVNLVVMTVQIAVTLFFMEEVFRIDTGIPFGQMALLLMLFSLVSISLSLVIVAFSKNSGVSGALQNIIITPTCLLAGCFFPSEIMPETVRRISEFMPQHWVLQSVETLQQGEGFDRIWFNLTVLAAFTLVFFLLAAYKIGRNNDTRNFI